MSDDKARKDLYEKLSEAERQVKNGEELLDVEEVFVNLKNKHANDIEEVDSEKFFATKRTGSLSAQYINLALKKAQEPMKLEKRVSAHILRHSFASSMIRANVPLPYLQKLLGHADLRVTSLYIHQDIEELRGAVESI